MTDQKDIYCAAKNLLNQHGEKAESEALGRMQKFMDEEDVIAASAWLLIAQAISELQKLGPDRTIH